MSEALAEVPSSMSSSDLVADISSAMSADPAETGDAGSYYEDPAVPSVEERATDGQEVEIEAAAPPELGAAPAAGQDDGEVFTKTADGKAFQIPIERWQQANEAAKFAGQLQARFPSIQDAEQAYHTAIDQQRLETDYLYGKDQDVDFVLNHWMGGDCQDPSLRSQFEQSFQRTFGNRLPEFLSAKSPEMHKSVAGKFASPYIEAAYDYAGQTGDADDLFRAQAADYAITGKFRPDAKPQASAISPELQTIRAERAQLDQMRQAAVDNDWKSTDQSLVNGPKWQKFDESIAQALKPAEGKFSPKVFGAIKMQARADLLAELKKDPDWVQSHNSTHARIESQYRAARAQGRDTNYLKPQIDAHIDNFLARSRQLLPGMVKDLVAEATAKAVADNRQGREQAAPRRQAPAAAPQQRSKVTSMTRDQMFADLNNILTNR